ncbi:MAG: tyrosine-type recombinase/integrase [Terriglobales bacterium]
MTRTNGKRWSYVTGEKGRNRVRAFAHPVTGMLYLEVREHGHKTRVSLGHRDKDAAKAKADELAMRLRQSVAIAPPSPTLGSLITEYLQDVTPTKGESKQAHDRRAGGMFTQYMGTRTAAMLNRKDWDGFIAWRRSSGDTRNGHAHPRQVGPRVITYDLKFLHSVLNWAATVRIPTGQFLLDRNPLKGMPWPRHAAAICRPTCTRKEYEALRSIAPNVHPLADLALLLVYETGHRMASVRQLRWEDVDDKSAMIHWRGEADKCGHDHYTPVTLNVLEALRTRMAVSRRSPWVFPCQTNPDMPISRHTPVAWWLELERRAGLSREKGRGWHSLRRAFATELKHLPLKDLQALGGWKSSSTLLECYILADQQTQRDALARRGVLTANGLATDTLTDTGERKAS